MQLRPTFVSMGPGTFLSPKIQKLLQSNIWLGSVTDSKKEPKLNFPENKMKQKLSQYVHRDTVYLGST